MTTKKTKIDVAAIVQDIRGLYAKDKKMQRAITTGDAVKIAYTPEDCVCAPTDHPLLLLSGTFGLPYNKIMEVAGAPDTGKSTLAGELMSAAQKQGIVVILWDAEQKFDANRFREQFKGEPKDVLLVQTNEIRYGGEIVRKYIHAVKKQQPDAKILVVWDSVGGSQSRSHAEFALDSDKSAQPGQDAKENGMIMKMLVSLINCYPDSIAVYMANQTYAKIGFMQVGDAASGGKKIEYHSSLIIFLKRIKTLTKQVKGQRVKEGIVTRATVTKNHLSQSATSIHQLDFTITAQGSKLLKESSTYGAGEETEDAEEE